jgi:hypothetical protein
MKKRGMSALAIAACAAATAVAIPTAASASTGQAAACDKVGIIYGYIGGNFTNVTFCGLGFYYRPSGGWQVQLVAPTTHNRWWFHQNADNSGWAWCTDYTHENGFGDVPIPSKYQNPGNIQVSANTATC